jgi:hypothetical protein
MEQLGSHDTDFHEISYWTVFRNYVDKITQGNETLFPNWQKELWQTFEETSRYMRLERVNKWPNSMTEVL